VICTDDQTLKLKQNLLEHHDFEVIDLEVFKYLCHWYGCDYKIRRRIITDSLDKTGLSVDLYPPPDSPAPKNVNMKKKKKSFQINL